MTTGGYISGAAHVVLMAYLMLGGLFSRDRLPEVEIADVSIISEAEYAALIRPSAEPEITDTAPVPTVPEVSEELPETPAPDAAPAARVPEAAEAPDAPEPAPEAPEIVVPEAEVTTEAPVLAPPTLDDGDTIAPDTTPTPAPRVAPDPAPMPDPGTERAPEVVEQTAPEPAPEAETVVEETPPAAPEAAAPEIVTEAETPDETAPVASIRPRTRPPVPVRTAEPAPEADPAPPENAVDAAVAAALADAARPAPAAPSGPPLTAGEKDGLRLAVQQCWNVGSLSTDALRTTVTVAVTLGRDGRPDAGTIRMIGSEGGTAGAATQAFEAARRAIIRCGARGFDLPAEKFDQWQNVEMTFNPERMRIR